MDFDDNFVRVGRYLQKRCKNLVPVCKEPSASHVGLAYSFRRCYNNSQYFIGIFYRCLHVGSCELKAGDHILDVAGNELIHRLSGSLLPVAMEIQQKWARLSSCM